MRVNWYWENDVLTYFSMARILIYLVLMFNFKSSQVQNGIIDENFEYEIKI